VRATDMLDAASLDAHRPGVEVDVRYDPPHPTRVVVEGHAAASRA